MALSLDVLSQFMGWCALINSLVLVFTTLALLVLKDRIIPLHSRWFGVAEPDLNRLYFSYLSHYKVITLAFFVVPYLALKLMVS